MMKITVEHTFNTKYEVSQKPSITEFKEDIESYYVNGDYLLVRSTLNRSTYIPMHSIWRITVYAGEGE